MRLLSRVETAFRKREVARVACTRERAPESTRKHLAPCARSRVECNSCAECHSTRQFLKIKARFRAFELSLIRERRKRLTDVKLDEREFRRVLISASIGSFNGGLINVSKRRVHCLPLFIPFASLSPCSSFFFCQFCR